MGTSEFDLSGRVAIVTGGGSGIGQHLAHALAEHGARVAVVDIVSALADAVAGELAARGTEALAKLAEAERQLWEKLWKDVDDLLKRAQEKATPETK